MVNVAKNNFCIAHASPRLYKLRVKVDSLFLNLRELNGDVSP